MPSASVTGKAEVVLGIKDLALCTVKWKAMPGLK